MFTKHLLKTSATAGIIAAALALGACGGEDGGSGTGSTSSSGGRADDRQSAMLEFARCMREHGVDMPDPQVDSQGRARMTMNGAGIPPETMEAAQEACEDKRPTAPADGPGREEANARGLALAQCMREHGIENFPDPKDGGIMITPDSGLDPEDPAFQEAQKVCEEQVGMPQDGKVTSP